ncbi:response regulator transcription factor [Subtercola sp. PAMC28395]|uniref:response regulator n=1 Tax=Subtercola sp. PAMC28395 TaxID=2846775 RepID=UPI001C0E4E5F|nr:response regulator transcription factor [Subtercola sp. PAMC28395]QWT23446.1 response regulator transcription factor [Subtercola sp. PAMC28395]
MRVLIVDDDAQILRALRINLSARGYDVDLASTGEAALKRAAEHPPELVVLDLGLPGLSGIEVIEGIRGWSAVPILVVSGRSDSADKVDALDAGADDYVTKPFAVDELLARIRALTRRTVAGVDEPIVRFGDIVVDLAAHEVRHEARNGAADARGNTTQNDTARGAEVSAAPEVVKLTPTEWHILEVLVRNPRRLVTKHHLLTTVWGAAYSSEDGYLRLYLAQLRKKLEPDPSRPRYFITEPGLGYRFNPDPALRD